MFQVVKRPFITIKLDTEEFGDHVHDQTLSICDRRELIDQEAKYLSTGKIILLWTWKRNE
jgi:hypothetical protein